MLRSDFQETLCTVSGTINATDCSSTRYCHAFVFYVSYTLVYSCRTQCIHKYVVRALYHGVLVVLHRCPSVVRYRVVAAPRASAAAHGTRPWETHAHTDPDTGHSGL